MCLNVVFNLVEIFMKLTFVFILLYCNDKCSVLNKHMCVLYLSSHGSGRTASRGVLSRKIALAGAVIWKCRGGSVITF